MKKKLAFLGAAAAALAMAAPAHAQSGHVQGTWQSVDLGGTDADAMGVSGSVALGSNFQVDAGWGTVDDADLDGFSIGGHLFSRNDQWLWGGFLGFSSLTSGGGGDIDETTAALQTQFYMERTTFSGNLSYSQGDIGGSDIDVTTLGGEIRHFATDNFSLQANASFGQAETGGADGDVTSFGVGAEWRIDNTPFSIYGGYQKVDIDGLESDAVGIGGRLAFGEESLIARNRSGAGLSRPAGLFDGLFGMFGPQ